MKTFLLGISFILTFTLIGCTSNSEQVGTESNPQQEQLNKLQKEIKELQQEVKVQSDETKSIQDELKAYKSFVSNDLINNLDKQQLFFASKKCRKMQRNLHRLAACFF